MYKKLAILLAGTAIMSGCASLNSIHRTSSPGNIDVVTVDAKQRHLIVVPEFENDVQTKSRICAESSPDVFSAFAASGGASGDKSGGAISFAGSETAATIARTQTINLLRESFYRTCERYASGAISKKQFIIQAARDQRSMVAILAIEQLTGAFSPKSTIISGPGTAASAINGRAAADLVDDINKRLKAAEAARDDLKSQVSAAEKDGVCSSVEDKKNAAECDALRARLSQAEKDVISAQADLRSAMELTNAAIASTSGGANSQGGGIDKAGFDSASAKYIAEAVLKINNASVINEPLMFCIAYLSDSSDGSDLVRDNCINIIIAKQQADQKSQGLDLLEIKGIEIGKKALDGKAQLIIELTQNWKCGDPATDNANYIKVIQDADKNRKSVIWTVVFAPLKKKNDVIRELSNFGTGTVQQFADSQKIICGGS